MTGPASCSMQMVTNFVGALVEGNNVEAGQTNHLDSDQTSNIGSVYGDSPKSSSNTKPSHVDKNFDAAQEGLVHNHMHYYMYIPDGDNSIYQACNRNIEFDP